KGLYGILVREPVAAGNRVVGVLIQAVARLDNGGGTAFRRNRVTAHGVNLGNHRHIEFRIDFGHRNDRAKTRAATANEQYIVEGNVHPSSLIKRATPGGPPVSGHENRAGIYPRAVKVVKPPLVSSFRVSFPQTTSEAVERSFERCRTESGRL